MARRIHAFDRQHLDRGVRPEGVTLITLLVVGALVGLWTKMAVGAPVSGELGPIKEVLADIQECMGRAPAPWSQAWQDEYIDTIRQIVTGHQDASSYVARLQILRNSFGPYWAVLRKSGERSLFEVHQAEIRWYVERLMTAGLSGPGERRKLREQYKDLMDHAAGALITQFPFLGPNLVEAARTDYLFECYRNIEALLLPIFGGPLSEEQVDRLKERWHALRYARVDLWRQLGGSRKKPDVKGDTPPREMHPDYLLTRRSLGQLQGQMWTLIPAPPDYLQEAVARQIAARKQRVQAAVETRSQERRLGVAVWQTEYLSFLLAVLLETAESF